MLSPRAHFGGAGGKWKGRLGAAEDRRRVRANSNRRDRAMIRGLPRARSDACIAVTSSGFQLSRPWPQGGPSCERRPPKSRREFRIGPANGREARESGGRMNASIAQIAALAGRPGEMAQSTHFCPSRSAPVRKKATETGRRRQGQDAQEPPCHRSAAPENVTMIGGPPGT